MEITKLQFEQVTSVLEGNYEQGEDFSTTATYSGRGMYGATCIGFTTRNRWDYEGFLIALHGAITDVFDEDNEAERVWMHKRTDSMGLGTIIYFPGVECPAVAKAEYDEGEDN